MECCNIILEYSYFTTILKKEEFEIRINLSWTKQPRKLCEILVTKFSFVYKITALGTIK